ncbi:hypothetical protein ACI3KS_13480 [Microbacterium sp. ZW T5_45]|uniref:hypothetical protein n=1 Tax=Microbacterium sp. ZW T5_45 TaxID=3378080 RepID=UPI0038554CAE
MTDLERRTITIGRDDQRAVLRGRLRQQRVVFALLAVVVALMVIVGALSTVGRPSGGGVALVVSGCAGVAVVLALLVWSQIALTRRQLPLGSEFSLQVTDDTLDLDGPGGSDRIRWRQLSNLRRVGGGIYLTITPSRAQLGLPGRLLGESALARAAELIAASAGTDTVEHGFPASAPVAGALASSITFTVEDQRIVRTALILGSRTILAIAGGLGLIAVGCVIGAAAGLGSSRMLEVSAMAAALALLLLVVLVVTVHHSVRRSLVVGTAQTLVVTTGALELTGPGGETRFAWNQLSDLRRRRGVVTVRSVSSKTTLAFVGRLVGDDMFAEIAQRIEAAGAAPTG